MVIVKIPVQCEFLRNGVLQFARSSWSQENALRYQIYILPEGTDYKDAAAFAYDASIAFNIALSEPDEGEQYS